MSTIALIPARGNSRGLPRKNIRIMNRKPLIAWTILAAQNSSCIDKVYVNTEDAEISSVSYQYNAEVIPRPIELAKHNSLTEEVVLQTIHYLEGKSDFENIILLQATSPLRTEKHIDEAWLQYTSYSDVNLLVSVYQPSLELAKAYKTAEDGTIISILSPQSPYIPRQEMPDIYLPNGAIYIFSKFSFLKFKRFPTSNVYPYLMQPEVSYDINTIKDFKLVEKLMREKYESIY